MIQEYTEDLSLEQIRKCVENNRDAQAVIITSPTYEGVVSEVREIVSYLHEMKEYHL